MLSSTNKLQMKQCKKLITYINRGMNHSEQGSINKKQSKILNTFVLLNSKGPMLSYSKPA